MDSKEMKPFDLKTVKRILQDRVSTSGQPSVTGKQSDVDESMQPIVGYRVIEKMGRGGMEVVFKAEDVNRGEIVALKLLYPGKEKEKAILQQFINEGMMLIRLQHPNILKGIDFGVSKGMYFLTLEFLQGESLDSFLDKRLFFTEQYAFEVALQLARALAYLEGQKIVHRDVKPANIMLIEDQVKLCDFAFALDTTQIKNEAGLFENTCGTVEYISPEQARGNKDIDIRSDVYSLGITCLHMITGKLPFEGKDAHEIMRQHIYEPIQLEKYSNISSTGRLLLRLMVAKDREDRVMASRLVPMLEKLLERYRRKESK